MPNNYPLEVSKKAWVLIEGGPYRQRPKTAEFGVKLAVEIDAPHDVSLPIPDFSVPEIGDLHAGIAQTLKAIRKGKTVYAGCMGGRGRTGLFLACLVKATGKTCPVERVRSKYNPHAVETQEQYEFVEAYTPNLAVRVELALLRAAAWFKGTEGAVRRI